MAVDAAEVVAIDASPLGGALAVPCSAETDGTDGLEGRRRPYCFGESGAGLYCLQRACVQRKK